MTLLNQLRKQVRAAITQHCPLLLLAILSAATTAAATAEPKIDFNRQIRPILSENCFLCHGPDESDRKGKLRLDIREEALKGGTSRPAIVPGAPEESELLARITHADPDEVMPPSKSGKQLTPEQIATLRQWIQQGAEYAVHWAYQKPTRSSLPAIQNPSWPNNPIDYFILQRLEAEGLTPQPEADRYALARRLAIDLTGLPPTPEEVERFVSDQNPSAYENFVDRLLAKKTFGEHWARLWLDLARYADSAGYADDPLRTIWAYRDYVINSFNDNKPLDQFTVEQLAGDLLPDPSQEQLVATAFHRNTMTNNEGGTNDEEFRTAAVVDRVNTTMAVWMGTSMACAQCHTHKYDPITQEEYFQFYAFFNNTEDADRPDESPVLPFFTSQQKELKTKLGDQLAQLEQKLTNATPELTSSFHAWQESFPRTASWSSPQPASVTFQSEPNISLQEQGLVRLRPGKETIELELPLSGTDLTALRLEAIADDSLPSKGAGHGPEGKFLISKISASLVPPVSKPFQARFIRIELPGKNRILSLAEVQVFAASINIASLGKASQSSTEFNADASLAVDGNTNGNFQEKTTTHTSSSSNPWWELDLQKSTVLDRIVIWNRTDNNLHARLKDARITALDENRELLWEHSVSEPPNPSVELVPNGARPVQFATAFADLSEHGFDPTNVLTAELKPGKGWTPGRSDAQNHWLLLLPKQKQTFSEGTTLRVSITQFPEHTFQTLGAFRLSLTSEPRFQDYLAVPPPLLTLLNSADPASENELHRLRDFYLRNVAPELKEERALFASLQEQLNAIKPHTVPILRDLTGDKRRKTLLQYRGNFMDTGPELSEAVPTVFHPLPDGAPRNRLGLAQWIIDRNNPLTARVLANHFWEQIFGSGLVRTSEEFGSQGELPSHPELLDWLALELMEGGWNLKRFLKTLVTSAAYRQSSKVTPELAERDPENRLLARGPRFRLAAETIRDQALFLGGLLSEKMHGPSVKPPRPTSGLSAAFGSSVDWKNSEGEDRYRRGIYTEWRRTSPYPSMSTFDAPNREVCTIRRSRSNTPLQALVTLNDPVYFEAAQGLARRMAAQSQSLTERVRFGFYLSLGRPPTEKELGRLVTLFGEALAEHAQADAKKVLQLVTDPIGPLPDGYDPLELAAWTTVANVLLNLDELLMRR